MSRSSSERSTPRLGAKSGAKLLLPDDMAKFFRDFFSKKFQRKRNGLRTSNVGKKFFQARGGGSEGASTARERGLAGVAAREPARQGTREAAGGGGCDGAAAWRTGLTARLGVAWAAMRAALRGGRDGAAAWQTGGGTARERRLAGAAATEPRHGERGLRHGWGGARAAA